MRYPIFGHRSNPAIDRYICKKKLGYIQSMLTEGLADWIEPGNQARGVLLRGRFLPAKDADTMQMVAGSGFDSAWGIKQSGWAGPLVWQLKTERPTA